MAEKHPGSDGSPMPSFDEVSERIRAINEKIIESGKTAGGMWLDAYEKALSNLLAFENQAADASQSEWISALARAHTDFITDITTAYTKAARELLK